MKIKHLASTILTSALLGLVSMGSALAYESCHKFQMGS